MDEQRVRLVIRQGEDYSAYIEWTDDDGNPIPSDPSATARLQARSADGSLVLDMRSGANHDVAGAVDILGTSGMIRLTAPRALTALLLPGVHPFDLVVHHKDPDTQVFRAGQRRYVVSGDLVVLTTITRA